MSHWNEFNYVVVNDDFERAVEDLVSIVEGQGEALDAHRPQLTGAIGRAAGLNPAVRARVAQPSRAPALG